MAAPYLLEIRTGGETKQALREIAYDVADEFGLSAATSPRHVPHISLFGSYNTRQGMAVKQAALGAARQYDVLPYRIEGFDRFGTDVIYANVVPSPELRSFRRELSTALRPLTYNYPPYDSRYFHDFHVTIARHDLGGQFGDVWQYVNDEHAGLRIDEYATRLSSLRYRKLLWEHDFPTGDLLRSDTATSRQSWKQTENALDELASDDDHDDLAPAPGRLCRALLGINARIRGW